MKFINWVKIKDNLNYNNPSAWEYALAKKYNNRNQNNNKNQEEYANSHSPTALKHYQDNMTIMNSHRL